MGVHFQTIVDVEVTAEKADALADAMLAWLIETGVVPSDEVVTRNEETIEGLVIRTRRGVFYSTTGEWEVTCPHCTWTTDPEATRFGDTVGAWEDLQDTINRWYDGGAGDVRCLRCAKVAHLNDWHWSPPWGFGHLGFTFWDWPPLGSEFLAEFSRRLGHRTVHPYGEL